MRKVLVVITALCMASYVGAPVFAADDGTTAVASTDEAPLIAAKGKRGVRRARTPKPTLEDTVRRIVDDAMTTRPMEWSYMAKRMQPPKSKKWQGRWNDLGAQGWELVGQNENVYIFKKHGSATASMAPAAAPKEKVAKEPKGSGTRHQPAQSESYSPGRKQQGRQWR